MILRVATSALQKECTIEFVHVLETLKVPLTMLSVAIKFSDAIHNYVVAQR